MVTDPNPFTAFEYLAYADQFYCAFYKAPTFHPSISWPRYFLLCHSIELEHVPPELNRQDSPAFWIGIDRH